MDEIPHVLTLTLSKAGYSGSDIDSVLPPFMSRRQTIVGLTWEPAAEGPDSFKLILEMVVAYGVLRIADGFLTELGRDLHVWSKQLKALFSQRTNPTGYIEVRTEDLYIWYLYEHLSGEDLDVILTSLSDLIKQADPGVSYEWQITLSSEGVPAISPKDK